MKVDFSVLQSFIETVFAEAGLPFVALALSLENAENQSDKITVTWYHHPAASSALPFERKEISLNTVVSRVYRFLQHEDISITRLGITAYLSSQLFDGLDENHPDRVDQHTLRNIVNINGTDCWIQILRKFDRQEFSAVRSA